jgi:hypothetical protein
MTEWNAYECAHRSQLTEARGPQRACGEGGHAGQQPVAVETSKHRATQVEATVVHITTGVGLVQVERARTATAVTMVDAPHVAGPRAA